MSEAGFTLEASRFKAIVAAYSAVSSDYFWHFTENGVKFKAMDPQHISMIAGEFYTDDYRLTGESFWVHPLPGSDMEHFKTALKGFRAGQEVRCEVKEGKMSVGAPPRMFTVAEVAPLEMQETFDPPTPKPREDVHLRLALADFRRIVKAAKDTKIYESIAFNVEEDEGKIVFFYEQKSIVKLDRGLPWLLEMRGRGSSSYGLSLFTSYLVLGLSVVVDFSYEKQGIGKLSYEEHDTSGKYSFSFWLAQKTMEAKDVEKLFEEKPPTRTLLFSLPFEKDVKVLASVFAAIGSLSSTVELSMGLLDDLWVYWSHGSRGYLRVFKTFFERWEAPERRLSGVFAFKDFAGWFKDVERLECFLETAPEEAMVVVGSGPKIAPKELRNVDLAHTLEVPEVKGTVVFRGPSSTMRDVMDDAEVAGDRFLVLVSTPFEISIVGRDRVYYRASLPVDSFQTIEEDHIVVTETWIRPLKDCFRHLDMVSFGKSDSGILLIAENPRWEARAVLPQNVEGEEYRDAERTYMADFVKPPAPPSEVKPLPAAPPPIEYVTTYILADVPTFAGADHKDYGPFKAGEEAWMPKLNAEGLVMEGRASWTKPPAPPVVFGPGEVKVIEQIVENCKYWQSNICKRDTMEKYAKEKRGVSDPMAIVDQLIRRGILYEPKPGYVGLTKPENYGLPPIGAPYYVPKEEKPEIVRVAEKLIDPARSSDVEVRSVASGPFRFALLNNGEIRVSSMGKFLSKDELTARPELLREAQVTFRKELESLGIPVLPEEKPEIVRIAEDALKELEAL